MPTLKIRFPGGRYHATPWGHHVNEGLIEWPPCPWRLLRALIACGFSSQQWREIPPVAGQLINKLAGVLPSYRLPEASAAHSRHFMPVGVLTKGREQKSLVFDTWANVGHYELFVHWPCMLSNEETILLAQLVTALGYLGRSESWVEACLCSENAESNMEFNAFPCQEGHHPGRVYEQVSLMAAIPADEYEAWRRQTTTPILDSIKLPQSARKPTRKQLEKLQSQCEQATAAYPPDLLSCLMKDTAWWKHYGWSQPPGSRRVIYWRRADSLQVTVPQQTRKRAAKPVPMMLLALTTPSGNRSALPPCTRTLPQAELFHRAIVARVANGNRVHCPEITGRDDHGRPLKDRHRHAHILPIDLDGDGHLDHLIVYAPMGLGDAAQRAIRTLRRTWTKGGIGDLQLSVVGSGDLVSLRALPPPLNRQVDRLLGPQAGSRIWTSVTPFVPPRFLKRRGRNNLFGQVNAELESRCLPSVETLEILPWNGDRLRLRHYVRRRQRGGTPPPVDIGFALRLRFSAPIHGPLTLGYASHFGLGRFAASD